MSLNVGVVGCGYWGPNLVRVLDSMPDVRVKTLCDTDASALEKMQARHPAVATTKDYNEVLGDDGIDAVVLTLPAIFHAEYTLRALDAGKHVFVEKPIAMNAEEADRIAAAAAGKNLTVMAGHLLLYHPGVRYMKELVDSGELGRIYYIYSQRLNFGLVRTQENALWSLAPHDISVLLYLLGELPSVVSANGESYIQENVQDTVFAHLAFSDKKLAHVHVSWLDPSRVRRFTVVGEKKMAVFDDVAQAEKVRIFNKSVERPTYSSYGEVFTLRYGDIHIPHVEMSEPLKIECRHFVDCVTGGEKPLTGVSEGRDVVKVLCAAQESLENGGKRVEIVP